MRAIEFKANIKNGMIEIPKRYRNLINRLARIIILTDEEEIDSPPPLDKKAILAVITELNQRKVFADITDPVEWQRSLRDEWN